MEDEEINKKLTEIRNKQIVNGEFENALKDLKKVAESHPNNNNVQSVIREINGYVKDEANILRYIERKNYKMACDHLRRLTTKAKECSRLKILKCECMIYTDKLADAQQVYPKIKDIQNGNNIELVHILMAFYKGDLNTAISSCEKIEENDDSDRLLTLMRDIRKNFELGEDFEKQKIVKKAQIHYNNIVELCDAKVNGLCLNKIVAVKALINRAKMNFLLQAYVDALTDTHRSINMLNKIEGDKLEIDKKQLANLWIQALICLASGNVMLKMSDFPIEFDIALDKCEGFEDLKKDVLAAVSVYEVNNKTLYVGKEKYQILFESVIPNESVIDICLQELRKNNKQMADALFQITKLPVESDDKEVNRVKNYISSRCAPEKFKTQQTTANKAKEINKLLGISDKSDSADLDGTLKKLNGMKLEEVIKFFNIKAGPNDMKKKLRLYAGKKFHPDQFKDEKDKAKAGKIFELLNILYG